MSKIEIIGFYYKFYIYSKFCLIMHQVFMWCDYTQEGKDFWGDVWPSILFSPVYRRWVLCLLRGLPLPTLCRGPHSPLPLGWASPDFIFPLLSLRVPISFLWSLPGWLPYWEQTASLKGQEWIHQIVSRTPRTIWCSTTYRGNQSTVPNSLTAVEEKQEFLKGRFLLSLSSQGHLFLLVCGQSMPSCERQNSTRGAETQEPQRHRKPYIWFLFTYLRESTNRIWEQNYNKFSSL